VILRDLAIHGFEFLDHLFVALCHTAGPHTLAAFGFRLVATLETLGRQFLFWSGESSLYLSLV
jgi:hypothetical protein